MSVASTTLSESPAGPPVTVWKRPPVVLACAMTVLVAAYWDTARSILAMWGRNPLGHEYLVPAAVVWLAWSRREDLRNVTPHPAYWWLPILAATAFGWLLGNLTNTTVVQQLGLAVMVIGLVWGSIGTSGVQPLIFPLGLLLFALPIGDWIAPPLQTLTAWFAVKLLQTFGFPAILQAHVISIPGSRWQIAQACSGINYLTSSLLLAYLYAGLVYRTWRHRIGLFLASGAMALLANGVRVFATILIASLGATQVAAGLEHDLIGWLVFCAILALTFLTCGRWKEGSPRVDVRPALQPNLLPGPVDGRAMWAFVALGLVIVGVAPLSAARLWAAPQDEGAPGASRPFVHVPDSWRAIPGNRLSWTPHFVEPTSETRQTYISGSHAVTVYVAYFGAGDRDAKLASSSNELLNAGWLPVGGTTRSIAVGAETFGARETVARAANASLLVWNWYWVDGTFTGHDAVAKLLLARSRLFRTGRDAVAIAVATQDVPGSDASLILGQFVAGLRVYSAGAPPQS